MKINQKTIPITSLELATVLMSENHKLVNINKDDPKKAIFYFEIDDKNNTIKKYYNSELKLNPKTLFINLRNLKNILHNDY